MMMLSVDPGATSGWALWHGETLSRYGQITIHDPLDAWEALPGLAREWIGSEVIVEGQWYRPPSGDKGVRQYHSAHWGAVHRLTETRCWWQAAAAIAGATVEVIAPGTWIRAMTSGAPGATPDDRIQTVVRMRWPQIRAASHASAAILLGAWRIESRGGRPIVR